YRRLDFRPNLAGFRSGVDRDDSALPLLGDVLSDHALSRTAAGLHPAHAALSRCRLAAEPDDGKHRPLDPFRSPLSRGPGFRSPARGRCPARTAPPQVSAPFGPSPSTQALHYLPCPPA